MGVPDGDGLAQLGIRVGHDRPALGRAVDLGHAPDVDRGRGEGQFGVVARPDHVGVGAAFEGGQEAREIRVGEEREVHGLDGVHVGRAAVVVMIDGAGVLGDGRTRCQRPGARGS